MLYNNHHVQLLEPAPTSRASAGCRAAESAAAARSGGCQFAGIGLLHLLGNVCTAVWEFAVLQVTETV